MIADCKDCGGEADLNDQACFTGILNGMSQEFNVDNVVLSHYIETKYTDSSMQILRMIVEIVHDLNHMGIRKPHEEYFESDPELSSGQKNRQETACAKCELKPEKIFSPLKNHFQRDISSFYEALKNVIGQIENQDDEDCSSCINSTKSDLIYIFNKLENLRAYVIYKGFQIVI